jgi:HipA-like kinase
MPLAIEQIRRMRGGAQAHLMRCADQRYYVVKFQNNPQGVRILANELLATRLAARLGLPVPGVAVIEVRAELIEQTEELVMQLGRGRAPCRPGLQFGSQYPGSPAETVVYDFLPDDSLREVSNLADFCGMFVFDKWTCNTNGRQAIFFRAAEPHYRAQMIDQGFCFNAGEWNFPDAPLRGLYARHRVYDSVRAMNAFDPWIARLETNITPDVLDEVSREIPPEWYDDEQDLLWGLLEQLLRRKKRVPELIQSAWKSSAMPFPNWT